MFGLMKTNLRMPNELTALSRQLTMRGRHCYGIVKERSQEIIMMIVLHEANPRQGKLSHRVILTSRGAGPLLRAEAAAFNDLAAFDLAIKNFELQIRKIHERAKEISHDSVRKAAVSE
jgi:ribosome-associated translation inhibitor RaiA